MVDPLFFSANDNQRSFAVAVADGGFGVVRARIAVLGRHKISPTEMELNTFVLLPVPYKVTLTSRLLYSQTLPHIDDM